MASLQEIKSRLSSISVTRKITKAMQMVASSKLKKVKKNLESIKEYSNSIEEVFLGLSSKSNVLKNYFGEKPNNKTLHIAIFSDIGLCGGYNNNVFKLLKNNLKQNDAVIVVGNKGMVFLKQLNKKPLHFIQLIGDGINYDDAAHITTLAINELISQNFSNLNIIHTSFINSITFNVDSTKIYPFRKQDIDLSSKAIIEFEPSIEIILKNIVPLYMKSFVFSKLVESKVSEVSSRRMAMEASTDNATELIDSLNLKYNRIRQSKITQEITEIVSGADND